ncbi:hypothetical protein E1292_07870 [Nonomuraea deserti]|uniref:Uncharacterized protein n=1 Tax=Nonomuraea deserti TaxID=1848322 RepID=A0A4R4W3E3_9ACTN|nr:hypothetical protein [Nonomuraea deserti]TDD10413.1 hypothetical protein E1292_07870 [Nonomuraea deserti]
MSNSTVTSKISKMALLGTGAVLAAGFLSGTAQAAPDTTTSAGLTAGAGRPNSVTTRQAIRINCGIVACSAYLSRARTVAAHQAYLSQGDAKVKDLNALCDAAKTGGFDGSSLCKRALDRFGGAVGRNLAAATKRGGCLVVRWQPAKGIFALADMYSFGNVPLSNPYCDAV